jgi:curved DNA-binding protein CbpA
MPPQPAVNYYDLLQINPHAEIETIERVYRILAARFHPDNQDTGDAEKFRLLSDAYQMLRDPVKRAEYDKQFKLTPVGPLMAFPRERLLFALWYLRSKRYVVQDDRSSFIISAEGVDYLESQLPSNEILYKIFRASETGVMVYPKALTSKTT